MIGTRSFGSDPAPRVGRHVAAWVGGLQAGGRRRLRQALPRPRRHRAGQPPHPAGARRAGGRSCGPATCRRSQAAVDAGVAAVMTSHISVPALDPDLPATLSAADPGGAARGAGLRRRDRQRRPRHGRCVRRTGDPRAPLSLLWAPAPTCCASGPTRTSRWCARSSGRSSTRCGPDGWRRSGLTEAVQRVDGVRGLSRLGDRRRGLAPQPPDGDHGGRGPRRTRRRG